MDYHLLPSRKRPLGRSLIQPAVFQLPIRKRPLDCSVIQPTVEKSSTSEAPEDGPCKRVTFFDQTSTKPPIFQNDGVQFQTAFSHYSPKSGEGNKQTNVPTYLFQKNAPAIERAWSGIMEVNSMMRLSVKMTARLSAKVSRKAYEFSKKIDLKRHSKLLPRKECYPRIFQDSRPYKDDIALYFYRPKDDRYRLVISSGASFAVEQMRSDL